MLDAVDDDDLVLEVVDDDLVLKVVDDDLVLEVVDDDLVLEVVLMDDGELVPEELGDEPKPAELVVVVVVPDEVVVLS
ncbi:MAG: hypothetical protein R2761_14300 [Acidimicrobiales bacterium]